jgi:predicted nucleic acid-binding protein
MTRRVLVDTDIILDLFLFRQPFFPAAADFFLLIQSGEIEGCVTPVILSNLFYILRKELTTQGALEVLRKLRRITRVIPVDEQMIDLALDSSFKDFEDAIQYYAASAQSLEAVVTRDKQDYRSAKLPILTAEEFVDLHYSQRH